MKVITLSNFSSGFLARFISGKIDCEIVDSEYNQYMQLISIPTSSLYKQGHDVALLILDYSTLLQSMSLDEVQGLLLDLVESYAANSQGVGTLLVSNAFIPRGITSTNSDGIYYQSKIAQRTINDHIKHIVSKNSNVHIFDLLSIYEEYGYYSLTDNSIQIFSDNPFSKHGLELISDEISDCIGSLLLSRKKCLVLDFDNTLWGGIAGEDALGVNVGSDRLGEQFLQFQLEIKKLKDKGVLLAACSKNNLEDAKLIFDKHPNMVLEWDDFIVHKVNWERKDINVLEIANELNIGDDSLVFIDDSPSERQLVKEGTKAIVPEFPKDMDLLRFISLIDRKYFSSSLLTSEDKVKHRQYLENIQRTEEKKKFRDLDSFINGLDMKLHIKINDEDDLERAFQLAQKTNQFNFTTKRYSKNDLLNFIKSKTADVVTCRVEDKFGDYGVTALMVVFREGNSYHIDNFLMSCRVLGKKVENVLFNWFVTNIYNGEELTLTYRPTLKNQQLEKKYLELGFDIASESELETTYSFKGIEDLNLSIEVNFE